MDQLCEKYLKVEVRMIAFMKRYSILLLRMSMGIVFFWFGILKFFPGLSPVDEIATVTIEQLTFGLIPPNISIIILAAWEVLIGIGFIYGKKLRLTLLLLFTQMAGTMTPLLLFPAETFTRFPYAPTLEGQYIIKNLVLISAGLVLGATIRGGRIVDDEDKKPCS